MKIILWTRSVDRQLYAIDEAETKPLDSRQMCNIPMKVPQPNRFAVKRLPMVIGTKTAEHKSITVELDDMDMIRRFASQPSPSQVPMPLHHVLPGTDLHLMFELTL